jgi:hypothetical protein
MPEATIGKRASAALPSALSAASGVTGSVSWLYSPICNPRRMTVNFAARWRSRPRSRVIPLSAPICRVAAASIGFR